MKTKKNKLVIGTEYYYPEFSAASGYFLTKIAETFSKKYNVYVFCTSKNIKNGKRVKKEVYNDIHIRRLKGGSIDKNKLIIRSLKFIYLSFQYLFYLIFHVRKKDKLCVVTNPAPIVLIGAFIKFIKKINYCIIVHDVFPENLSGVNILSENSKIYRFLLLVFNWGYIKADKLIVLGSDMKEVFQKKLPGYKGEIIVIPNWTDTKEINTESKQLNPVIKKFHLEKKTVFGFAGNIGRAQGILNLIESAKKINTPDIHFIFFGNGAMLSMVKKADETLNNITYAGSFPRQEKNVFLTACDVALISLSKGIAGLGVPSKTYDILASGRPILVIADDNSEIVKLVNEYDIGWTCPPDDPLRLTNMINHIHLHTREVQEKGLKARKIAETMYDKKIILEKYLQAF